MYILYFSYILVFLAQIDVQAGIEEVVVNAPKHPNSHQKSFKSKGILNPYIDNFLADESEKSHMAIKDMRLDELYPKIEQYFKSGYLEYAKAALERVITIEKNQTKLKDARLRLAKVYYDLEEYAEAQKAYTEFAELYPGSDKTEFAKYKAVDCGCKQITDCDRDQKSTYAAAKMAKDYLSSESCQEYRQETKALCELCYDRLLDHELYVAEFHISRAKYTPAQKRLDYAKKNYLPELPNAQTKIAKVEDALKQASPSYQSFSEETSSKTSANKTTAKVSFVDRF